MAVTNATATTPANLYPEGGPGRQLKSRLAAGQVLVGAMLTEYARPSLIKLYKHAGFDFVYVEYEHVFFGPAELADAVLCARDNGIPVISKTPQLERQEVAKLLECGVAGIQLPRTESREQVETLKSYIKFPPEGTRAAAPGQGNSDYVRPVDMKGWMAGENADTTLVVHIETKVGYDRAEEIVSTPGVDMVYVGPGDFSIEMGHPGEYDHPEVVGKMREIKDICRKHNVPFGTTASGVESAGRWIADGALFFETRSELALIREGATKLVEEYRAVMP